MTQNQISYWRLEEDKRTNAENEQIKRDTLEEQARHNRKQEDYNDAYLAEQERAHRASESLDLGKLNESITHDRNTEALQRSDIEAKATHYKAQDDISLKAQNLKEAEFNLLSPYQVANYQAQTANQQALSDLNAAKAYSEKEYMPGIYNSQMYANYTGGTAKLGDALKSAQLLIGGKDLINKGGGGNNSTPTTPSGKVPVEEVLGDTTYRKFTVDGESSWVPVTDGISKYDLTQNSDILGGKAYQSSSSGRSGSSGKLATLLGGLTVALMAGVGGKKYLTSHAQIQ